MLSFDVTVGRWLQEIFQGRLPPAVKRFLVFAGSFSEFEPMGGRFIGETDDPEEAMKLACSECRYDWYTVYDRSDRTLTCNHADVRKTSRHRFREGPYAD